jgi:hypothetical protein
MSDPLQEILRKGREQVEGELAAQKRRLSILEASIALARKMGQDVRAEEAAHKAMAAALENIAKAAQAFRVPGGS